MRCAITQVSDRAPQRRAHVAHSLKHRDRKLGAKTEAAIRTWRDR